MGKAKKDHRKRVAARNTRLAHAKNRLQKQFAEFKKIINEKMQESNRIPEEPIQYENETEKGE